MLFCVLVKVAEREKGGGGVVISYKFPTPTLPTA